MVLKVYFLGTEAHNRLNNGNQETQNNQGNKNKMKARIMSKSKTRNSKCYGSNKTCHFVKEFYKKKE